MRTAPDTAFGFSQARVQARHGSRLAAADWQQLEASGDLGTLLHACRSSPLARWVSHLGTQHSVHEIELGLRRDWAAYVEEVAAWQPRAWRPTTLWLRWLPWLPGLQKLARTGRPPAWMRGDPVLGPIVATEPQQRRGALAGSPLQPLAAGFVARPDVARAWLQQWRRLWPASPRAVRPALERLARELEQHGARVAALPDGAASLELRQQLVERLARLFRRHPLTPAATLAHLALVGLDLERLGGTLALRALRAPRSDA